MFRFLRGNMAAKTCVFEDIPEEYAGLGGRALTSTIVAREVNPICTPLGPHSKLVVAPSLLGATIVDVIFGTLATLLAGLVTYKLRNIRFKGLALAASLPPVVFNAAIIGIEIAVMFPDPSSSAPLWLACVTNGISVGIGELISCTVLGVLLVRIIEASPAVRKVFES